MSGSVFFFVGLGVVCVVDKNVYVRVKGSFFFGCCVGFFNFEVVFDGGGNFVEGIVFGVVRCVDDI